MSRQIVTFDIWGDYAHFKKIYATTSAISYAIPPKPALYGYIGAILGLSKVDNDYLRVFADKQCLIGLSVLNPIVMTRLGNNLRSDLRRNADKPRATLTEYIYQPKYRLYVSHQNLSFQQTLQKAVKAHQSVFTPSLGLAGLLSNFEWIGEESSDVCRSEKPVSIHSIIPRKYFLAFNEEALFTDQNDIMAQSLLAMEMNTDREVIERDDILFDRKGKAIQALVTEYYQINGANIILF